MSLFVNTARLVIWCHFVNTSSLELYYSSKNLGNHATMVCKRTINRILRLIFYLAVIGGFVVFGFVKTHLVISDYTDSLFPEGDNLREYLHHHVDMGDYGRLLYGINISELQMMSYTKEKPFVYLEKYKNPCWLEHLPSAYMHDYRTTFFHNYADDKIYAVAPAYNDRLEELDQPWRLRCLPYFYMLGVTKSGTTDLFRAITTHPQVHGPWVKEPMYWNWRRYPQGSQIRKNTIIAHSPFHKYVNMFDHPAHMINTTEDGQRHIIGDGSSFLFWEDTSWLSNPGNSGLDSPQYTTAMALHAATPDARLVLILRNPVDRLYSHYMMLSERGTPGEFHQLVMVAVRSYASCINVRGVRPCAYNATLASLNHLITVTASLYSIHLREWLTVFPRSQMIVLKSEEYFSDRMHVLQDVFNFLELDTPTNDTTARIQKQHPSFQQRYTSMLQDTRLVLEEFFMPHNMDLEAILDRSFWSTTEGDRPTLEYE